MSTTTLLAPQQSFHAIPELQTDRLLGWLSLFQANPLEVMQRAFAAHGDLVRVRAGHLTVLVASHPDHFQRILVDNTANYEKRTRGYQLLRSLLGQGLLTSDGELWKRQRRTANPAFRRKMVAGFARSMVGATQQSVASWQAAAARGESLDMAEEMMQLTLRIAGETLFSQDISTQGDAIGGALGEVMHAFGRLSMSANPLAAWMPTAANWRYHQAGRTLDRVVKSIVAQRKAEQAAPDAPERVDLLGMFMSARDPETGAAMSDQLLRDEVLTMLLAGHETTANALAWSLHLLGQHPDVADRVAREVDQVLGDGPPDAGALRQLPLTVAVLKESMRLFPPAWVEARVAKEADRFGVHEVPAGTFVFAPQAVVHRHPRYWVQPDAFRPERWLDDRAVCPDGSPRPRLAYLPFAAGQRKCIGEHFAMMEATIVLALAVRALRFWPAHDRPVVPLASVTLRPAGGLPMVLQAR